MVNRKYLIKFRELEGPGLWQFPVDITVPSPEQAFDEACLEAERIWAGRFPYDLVLCIEIRDVTEAANA